jgi:hypothetical protein
MRFNFTLGNHSITGAPTLLDPMENIACQLRDLGHDVERDDFRLSKDCINIFFEAFDRPYAARLRQAKEAGARFIIIATERPGEPGFNNQNGAQMVERQIAFPECAALAEAVWCLVPEMVEWSRQWNPKSCYLELGHSASREGLLASDIAPEFDFAFFGSMTRRRHDVLADFARLGYPACGFSGEMPPTGVRDDMVRRCRLVLSINPWEGWSLVSNSRLSTALHLGRAVIAEPIEGSFGPWGDIVRVSQTPAGIVDTAIAALEDWHGLWEHQMGRFRALMSAEACLREPLEMLG